MAIIVQKEMCSEFSKLLSEILLAIFTPNSQICMHAKSHMVFTDHIIDLM